MQGVFEIATSMPFAALSARRAFVSSKRSVGFSLSRLSGVYTSAQSLYFENECTFLCNLMSTFPKGEELAEERRHVPWCHRVLNASVVRSVE